MKSSTFVVDNVNELQRIVSPSWVMQWSTAYRENLRAFLGSYPEPEYVERYWREKIPYRYDRTQPVVSMLECVVRRYGACGDASAAMAAAAAASRLPWEVHIEMCDGSSYAHARTIVSGVARDPTAEASVAAPDRRVVLRSASG